MRLILTGRIMEAELKEHILHVKNIFRLSLLIRIGKNKYVFRCFIRFKHESFRLIATYCR